MEIIKITQDGSLWSNLWPCSDLISFRETYQLLPWCHRSILCFLHFEKRNMAFLGPKGEEGFLGTRGACLITDGRQTSHSETQLVVQWSTQTLLSTGVLGPAIAAIYYQPFFLFPGLEGSGHHCPFLTW